MNDRDKQNRRDGFRSRILARRLADDVLRTVSGGCNGTWVVPYGGPGHADREL